MIFFSETLKWTLSFITHSFLMLRDFSCAHLFQILILKLIIPMLPIITGDLLGASG